MAGRWEGANQVPCEKHTVSARRAMRRLEARMLQRLQQPLVGNMKRCSHCFEMALAAGCKCLIWLKKLERRENAKTMREQRTKALSLE
eukprot:5972244-Pleurochrysis_carterae.AAC.5